MADEPTRHLREAAACARAGGDREWRRGAPLVIAQHRGEVESHAVAHAALAHADDHAAAQRHARRVVHRLRRRVAVHVALESLCLRDLRGVEQRPARGVVDVIRRHDESVDAAVERKREPAHSRSRSHLRKTSRLSRHSWRGCDG